MKVHIQYFKETGKYYSDGEYETERTYHHDIVNELRKMFYDGYFPGLSGNELEFIAVINYDSDNCVPFVLTPENVKNFAPKTYTPIHF
jgi:hypothetical protein